jgi:hypothetical protein
MKEGTQMLVINASWMLNYIEFIDPKTHTINGEDNKLHIHISKFVTTNLDLAIYYLNIQSRRVVLQNEIISNTSIIEGHGSKREEVHLQLYSCSYGRGLILRAIIVKHML